MSDGDIIQIPQTRPGLGRHIQHDPRNRRFPVLAILPPHKDIRWRRTGSKLNQNDLGACVGYAAAHTLNTYPLRKAISPHPTYHNQDAIEFYSGGTARDPWEGQYPPEDSGTTGLAVCEELLAREIINRYEWAFGFQQGLSAITLGALMQGTYWTDGMFSPDASGQVHPTGGDVGGHEYCWLGVEYRSKLSSDQNRSWFMNSWGATYAKAGYFWMSWKDHEELLARDGDLVRPII